MKLIENDRLLPPRTPLLMRLASALGVPPGELAADNETGDIIATGPGHAALPAVRAAVRHVPLVLDQPPQPLGHLKARLDIAWRARHASPEHRTVVGALLPDLIRDTHYAARFNTGRRRNQANRLLADVLGLAQMFVAYQPAGETLWRIAERSVLAAQDSGDPRSLALSTWLYVEAARDAADWDTAMTTNLDALKAIEPRLADGDDDLLALWGTLQTGAALTLARTGHEGRAWRHWDLANDAVKRLPTEYCHPYTWFSRPVVGFYALSVATELHKPAEAIRQAARVDPVDIASRPRRARHLVEVARAHRLNRDHEGVARTLQTAYDSAPETLRYNGYARQMTLELLDDAIALRRDAEDLAVKIGLPI